MKKTYTLLAIVMLALIISISQAVPVGAVSQSDYADLVAEEMTAEYLYSELYKKYPENVLFSNLAASEQRHSNALKRVLSKMGVSVEGVEIQDIEIPATKEEALAFALTFEQEDIDMLEKLLETVEDERLERVLKNLLKGSTRHYKTLEKAIEEGIDNLTCDKDGARQGAGQNRGAGRGGSTKSGQRTEQGRGSMRNSKGWGRK